MTEPANPIQDQVEAAAQDAARRFTSVTRHYGDKYETKRAGGVVREVAERFVHAVNNGGMQCEHIPSTGPSVVFGAACLPGVIGCAECITAHAEYRHMIDQIGNTGRTCDACGNKASMGKNGMIQCGRLLLMMSLCVDCCNRDEG